jgi:alcohol dehydrogenase (NADP+)
MVAGVGYAAHSADAKLDPFSFQRRDPRPQDVQIEILYCGVCHSDLHTARNEWRGTVYPVVPGHEIIGRVVKAGGAARRFQEGDIAGVGVFVDSCRQCASCRSGNEQYCENTFTGTYNDPDKISGGVTYGGYSKYIVVDEGYGYRIPANLSLAGAAPLLCAGITTYSPLRHWGAGPGKKVGVVGLGGLGHMAVKLSHALGAHTVMFTTSENKVTDAKKLGADEVVLSRDAAAMKREVRSFDLIIDAVSARHDISDYLELLKRDCTLVQVGLPADPLPVRMSAVALHRRSLSGSLIGGLKETQEMLDFCGEHDITAEVELIPIQKVNEAYERMLKSDVKYRFVLDMGSLQPV